MTRLILAISAAFLVATAALFGSAAEACISCNYTPEVAKGPGPGEKAKSRQKKSLQAAGKERKAAPTKKRTPPKGETIAKGKQPSKTEAGKTEPADTEVAKAETETEPEEETESRPPRLTGSSALIQPSAQDEQEPEGECKKFFPAVGKLMTVPCN